QKLRDNFISQFFSEPGLDYGLWHMAGPEAVDSNLAGQLACYPIHLRTYGVARDLEAQLSLAVFLINYCCVQFLPASSSDSLNSLDSLTSPNSLDSLDAPTSLDSLVRKGGLEPPYLSVPDPKSGASTNSATFARLKHINIVERERISPDS